MNGYREYAFYVPELDEIVIQFIHKGCVIAFEWERSVLTKLQTYCELDPLDYFFLMPLGEV